MIGRIVKRVIFTLTVSAVIGYAEYRLKGGEPITKLYREIAKERMAAETAKARMDSIVVEGTVV